MKNGVSCFCLTKLNFFSLFFVSLTRYNKVLKDGLPDWRSAMYYYRRYRKMGLAEMVGLVFVIFTIGQYIVAWAVYAEKKYTAVSRENVFNFFLNLVNMFLNRLFAHFRKRFSVQNSENCKRKIKQL